MTTFLLAFVLFSLGFLLISTPVFVMASRRDNRTTFWKFVRASMFFAVICAVVSANSARLVGQCEDAGNPQCFDFGSRGFQYLVLGGFAFVSWIRTVDLYRN